MACFFYVFGVGSGVTVHPAYEAFPDGDIVIKNQEIRKMCEDVKALLAEQ